MCMPGKTVVETKVLWEGEECTYHHANGTTRPAKLKKIETKSLQTHEEETGKIEKQHIAGVYLEIDTDSNFYVKAEGVVNIKVYDPSLPSHEVLPGSNGRNGSNPARCLLESQGRSPDGGSKARGPDHASRARSPDHASEAKSHLLSWARLSNTRFGRFQGAQCQVSHVKKLMVLVLDCSTGWITSLPLLPPSMVSTTIGVLNMVRHFNDWGWLRRIRARSLGRSSCLLDLPGGVEIMACHQASYSRTKQRAGDFCPKNVPFCGCPWWMSTLTANRLEVMAASSWCQDICDFVFWTTCVFQRPFAIPPFANPRHVKVMETSTQTSSWRCFPAVVQDLTFGLDSSNAIESSWQADFGQPVQPNLPLVG